MADEVEKVTAAEQSDAAGDADFPELDEQIQVEPEKPSRLPLYVSMLALLVAAVALAGVAYVGSRESVVTPPDNRDTAELAALTDGLRAAEDAIARLGDRLGDAATQETATGRELQRLERQFERRLESFASLPGRIDNVENTMSSIQGISTGVRDTWLLAEAEYYMQIANAQLQLAGNPHLARLALLQADERVQQLANPALTNVRRTLSNELRALETMARPDIEGISLTLASLAAVVDALPLQQDIERPADAAAASADSELSGLDRAIASFKGTLNDVVSVRRVDENVRPLIAPESAYFLRANLSLQLQAARLALLRGEKSVFQQSLDDADRWLDDYYDTESLQVQSAKQTISEIRDRLFDIEAPDISESLRLLRQFGTLSETPAAPAERPAAPAADREAATPETTEATPDP